jgi:hypothetical protein
MPKRYAFRLVPLLLFAVRCHSCFAALAVRQNLAVCFKAGRWAAQCLARAMQYPAAHKHLSYKAKMGSTVLNPYGAARKAANHTLPQFNNYLFKTCGAQLFTNALQQLFAKGPHEGLPCVCNL